MPSQPDMRKLVQKKIDTTRPSVARMYDYFLGGTNNFEVDRQAAEQVLQWAPQARVLAQVNRAFLRRAVQFMVDEGIDQFLDLGSGIPTAGNVHEIAQTLNPNARVIYVDIDPIAVAHAQIILEENSNAAAIQGDVCNTEAILNHPTTKHLLDFNRPIGILVIGLLYFIDDENVVKILQALHTMAPSGSYLAISHFSDDEEFLVKNPAQRAALEPIKQIYERASAALYLRKRPAIEAFFDGWDLVPPGVVMLPRWRPEAEDDLLVDRPEESFVYGGVARKP